MANPFVLKDSSNSRLRDKVCDLFEELIGYTMVSPMFWSSDQTAAFGRARGFEGPTTPFDGVAARDMVRHIGELARSADVLLQCQCSPLRCHGESVARHACFEGKWLAADCAIVDLCDVRDGRF